MICDLDERRLYACAGPPCENPYQVFEMERGVTLASTTSSSPAAASSTAAATPGTAATSPCAATASPPSARRGRCAAGASSTPATATSRPASSTRTRTRTSPSCCIRAPRRRCARASPRTSPATAACRRRRSPSRTATTPSRTGRTTPGAWTAWPGTGARSRQYLGAVRRGGHAINIAPLVGHGALRLAVVGFAERAVTERELARMERLLDASHARRRARPVERASSIRRAASRAPRSSCACAGSWRATRASTPRTCAASARRSSPRSPRRSSSGAPPAAPWRSRTTRPSGARPRTPSANLALIEEARRGGLDVDHRQRRAHRSRAAPLAGAAAAGARPRPRRAHRAALGPRARAPALRREVLEDALPGAGYAGVVRHGRFDRVVVFHAGRHPELRGRSVADIAAERGADGFDTFLDLIVEEDDDIVGLFDYIEEKNIRALLQSPLAMISSDGLVMAPPEELDDPSLYWPCSYGEYPGMLERYVRDEPVLRLEEAIRKMTSFPAQRFGLLRPGRAAPRSQGRPRRLRPRPRARPGDQPVPARVPLREHPARRARGHRLGARQRRAGDRGGRAHGRAARAGCCGAEVAAPPARRRPLLPERTKPPHGLDAPYPRAVLGHRVESRR